MLNRRLSLITLILCLVLILGMVAYSADVEPFKVKLTLFERFIVLGLLPAEGSITTLKIVGDLQMELAPNEEEYQAAGLKDDLKTGGVSAELGWDKVESKEISFGVIAKAIIVDALTKLSEAEKLTMQQVSTYFKFIPAEEIKNE